MKRTISNSDDVIDSRDVIGRIEELEAELRESYEEWDNAQRAAGSLREPTFDEWLDDENSDEAEEYRTLMSLAEEGSGSPDWIHGETLIRDSYFKEYAMELAHDVGAVTQDQLSHWPFTCIDWDDAAKELKYDYFSVDFGGVDYWIRS